MSTKNLLLFLIIVVVVTGVFIGVMNLKSQSFQYVTGDKGTAAATPISSSDYQAVFLINNQVYFGKLTDEGSAFPVLRDIYYLQVNQQIQPAPGSSTPRATANDVSLIKLGGELHGPTDEMRINRNQILLIENLRADSNVVKAIKAYKASAATSTPKQ